MSCNSKGWTSNEYGVAWLKKCFEPATRDKADDKFRLLICDGHDSHISAEFLRHCIANRIVLMLLPPHCSHLMQPLNVSVFFPLKQAIGMFVDRMFRTGIGNLQKIEWFKCFISARAKALNNDNIEGAWQGAKVFAWLILRRYWTRFLDLLHLKSINLFKTPSQFFPQTQYNNLTSSLTMLLLIPLLYIQQTVH